MSKESYEYLVLFEKSKNGFGAFSPDLPGCVAVGETKSEAKKLIREAIKLHIKGLLEDGIDPPKPVTKAEYVKIAA